MQLTIIWLSSRACQQSTAVEELQKLPLHGHSRHRIFFLAGTPTGETKANPPDCGSASPAGGDRQAEGCPPPVQLPSLAPVPASRLLLPVDPDLPHRDTIHFRIRMSPAVAAAHGSSSGQGLVADETW